MTFRSGDNNGRIMPGTEVTLCREWLGVTARGQREGLRRLLTAGLSLAPSLSPSPFLVITTLTLMSV